MLFSLVRPPLASSVNFTVKFKINIYYLASQQTYPTFVVFAEI